MCIYVRPFDCPPPPPVWKDSAPTGRIFVEVDIWEFLSRTLSFHQYVTRITSALYEDVYTFMTMHHWIILRTRTVLNKSCRENQNTHFTSNNLFQKIVQFIEIVWKNMLERDRSQVTMQKEVCALHAGYPKLQTRTQNM